MQHLHIHITTRANVLIPYNPCDICNAIKSILRLGECVHPYEERGGHAHLQTALQRLCEITLFVLLYARSLCGALETATAFDKSSRIWWEF